MKLITLIPLLLVSSCASPPRPRVGLKPLLPPAPEPIEALRFPEVIRAYHLGRYVDPNHPGVLHEQHPVYRIEAHTCWDLDPGDPRNVSALNPRPDAAYSPAPTNDVILAELNRQKDATERVMGEAYQLARSYDELQKVIKEMTAVAKNHALMGARIGSAERRLAELEKELQKLNAPSTTPTNEIRSFTIEEPDPPKP